MTISSSLSASISGLNSNATRLASISDNIANSATNGYKRTVTDFESIVINEKGEYAAGGVRSSNRRVVDQKGGLVATSRALDLATQGRGMIPVTTKNTYNGLAEGTSPLRMITTGSFSQDKDGFLVSTTGLTLLGWPADLNGKIPQYSQDTPANLQPVRISDTQLTGNPTKNVHLGLNLPATEARAGTSGDDLPLSVEYFGNLGDSESLDFTFHATFPDDGIENQWVMTIRDSASSGGIIGEYVLKFNDGQTNGGSLASVTQVSGGGYNAATGAISLVTNQGPLSLEIGTLGSSSGITQLAGPFFPDNISKDGSPTGILSSIEVDKAGHVIAQYNTGFQKVLYKVPLVDVPNVNGLDAVGAQAFEVSHTSGDIFLWEAGTGPTGNIISYAQEESTTDIAHELTSLIQTQRAYSSNAKVVQAVDEMIQETTNMKR